MNLQISNTKLVHLWQIIFAEGQIYHVKKLRHYIEGCYPRDAKPLLLFDFLSKNLAEIKQGKINATQAYLVTFKQKRLAVKDAPIAEKQLKLVFSELFQRTEEYIIQTKALYDAQSYPSSALLELYTKPSLKTCFDDYWRKAESLVAQPKSEQPQGFTFLYHQFKAYKTYNDYCLQMQLYEKLLFNEQTIALRNMLTAHILQHHIDTQTFKIDYQFTRENEEAIAKHDIPLEIQQHDSPLVAIYKNLTRSLNTPEMAEKETTVLAALQDFETNQLLFSEKEKRDILSLIGNCINDLIKSDRLNDRFLHLLLRTYLLRETGNLLLSDEGRMSIVLYNNFIVLSLITGKIDYAKFIAEKYKDNLVASNLQQRLNAQETYNYNLANIAFFEKKYAQVETLLRFHDAQHSILNLHAEVLILKAYFEQDLIEFKGKYIETPTRSSSFMLRLQQFEQHLLREKTANIIMYKNFSRILFAIANLYKTNRIGIKIDLPANWLEDLFANHTPTFEERWLRSKVHELTNPTL